jgi:hypothetical protein
MKIKRKTCRRKISRIRERWGKNERELEEG